MHIAIMGIKFAERLITVRIHPLFESPFLFNAQVSLNIY